MPAAIDVWQILIASSIPQFEWLLWPPLAWRPLIRSCWQYAVESPQKMIHLAAAAVMVRHAWLRAGQTSTGECQWLVAPGRLLTAWLISAATLSIMKTFRVYKPVLEQAWFLEVLHASPRWIASATADVRLAPLEEKSA